MKQDRIKLSESQLRKMIAKSIKESLSEVENDYQGWADDTYYERDNCYKKDENPDYESYDDLRSKKRSVAESQLRKMVSEAVRNAIKENLNKPFDFEDFVEILDKNGYAYSNYYDVSSKDGRSGTRFEISEYPYNNPTTDLNTLKQELMNAGGTDRFIFSQGVHQYAPELKSFSIILLDN